MAKPGPFLLAFLTLSASQASADIVVFKSGRTMSVQAYRAVGTYATLVLREGGEVTFPVSMVARVDADEVPHPPPSPRVVATRAVAAREPDSPPGVRDQGLSERPFAELISTVSASEHVDPRLVHAVIEAESSYRPRARSPKGARGLMQLMPATARQYGVKDSYDPKSNVEAGVRHLKDLMSRFDLTLALGAYNAGEGTIRRYGGLPPFAETQNYVTRILRQVER